ncbi:MAG: hypothetical protein WC402_03095 [Candidatus Pacearchaeota archaeon]|jgi:hypothetical protein
MSTRAYYKKQVYYGEDFAKEMELFERNIVLDDKRFKNLKQKYRFSAVIRKWIKNYNVAFAKENLDGIKI